MRPEEKVACFLKRVEELRNRRMVKESGGINFSFDVDKEAGFSVEIEFPDEEDFRSFLMGLRLFIAEDEPTKVEHIYNLCYQGVKSDSEFRKALVEWRKRWKAITQVGSKETKIEGQRLSPETVAKLWISGYYFHSNAEKRRQLEKILGYGWEFPKIRFVNFVVNAAAEIIYLGNLVAYGVQNDLFEF